MFTMFRYDRLASLFLLTAILILVVTTTTTSASATTNDEPGATTNVLSDYKLDKILEQLDYLTHKQKEFSSFINQKCCQCQKADESRPGSEFRARIVDQGDQNEPSSRRFNKLAANFNSIPSSSPNWDSNDEISPSVWSHQLASGQVAGSNPEKLLLVQYESMFASALSGLNSLFKDNITGMRLNLNKLMNRMIDNSYQYNMISNQLAYIKDECSLAAYTSFNSPNVTATAASAAPASSSNQLKTSDLSLLVKLLAQEVEQAMLKHRAEAEVRREDELLADRKQLAELGKLSKKLDDIDSIVKQLALLLNKLNTPAQASVVLSYNNTEQPNSSSRWLSGSKLPTSGLLARQRLTENARVSKKLATNNCQSKTNLTKPLSCQQLHLAGANCTGQYYVFIRNSIKHLYCDMNPEDGGGWTVILRRLDKSLIDFSGSASANASMLHLSKPNYLLETMRLSQLNFNQNWSNYKAGFGYLDEWSEFFIGLELLNQILNSPGTNGDQAQSLTSKEFELQVDLETSELNQLHLRFDQFSIESEQQQFRLKIGQCNATQPLACWPLASLNQTKFYAHDTRCPGQIKDEPGWWQTADQVNDCSTAPKLDRFHFTRSIGKEDHLYWPSWPHSHEPLRRLSMKIRRIN